MSPKEVLLNHFNIKENIEKTPQPKKILIINLSQSVTNIDKTKPKINVDCLFSGIFIRVILFKCSFVAYRPAAIWSLLNTSVHL